MAQHHCHRWRCPWAGRQAQAAACQEHRRTQSGELVQTLIENDLVDEYFLTVYPLVMGGGKKLIRDGWQLRRLELVDSKTTSTDGVVLTYRPTR